MTNEVAIEIMEMLKIRPRRGKSMIIAQTAVNVALQTGINALYEKKDRIEKADNDLSSGLEKTRKNSKKLEKNFGELDCISRAEQIDWLYRLKSKIKIFMPYQWQKPFQKALDMAIKALEQEPCCNCIQFKRYAKEMGFEIEQEQKSEWEQDHAILKAYSDGANEVLDKIRAEIWDLQYGEEEKSMTDENRADAYNNAIKQVIEIIDKYKGESEKQTDGNHENKKS